MDDKIELAHDEALRAQALRAELRRKTHKGDPIRQHKLKLQIKRLNRAMKPVWREICSARYDEDKLPRRADLLYAGELLRRERRKLYKMLPHQEGQ